LPRLNVKARWKQRAFFRPGYWDNSIIAILQSQGGVNLLYLPFLLPFRYAQQKLYYLFVPQTIGERLIQEGVTI
jgi:hypothetical protein